MKLHNYFADKITTAKIFKNINSNKNYWVISFYQKITGTVIKLKKILEKS